MHRVAPTARRHTTYSRRLTKEPPNDVAHRAKYFRQRARSLRILFVESLDNRVPRTNGPAIANSITALGDSNQEDVQNLQAKKEGRQSQRPLERCAGSEDVAPNTEVHRISFGDRSPHVSNDAVGRTRRMPFKWHFRSSQSHRTINRAVVRSAPSKRNTSRFNLVRR